MDFICKFIAVLYLSENNLYLFLTTIKVGRGGKEKEEGGIETLDNDSLYYQPKIVNSLPNTRLLF